MNNRLLYLSFFLFTWTLCWPAQAKDFPGKWCEGEIRLEGETLKGKISYDPRHDVVFFREEGQIRTFTAHTVRSFGLVDEEAGLTRTFQALPAANQAQPGRRQFYEIAVDGDLTLLRKEKIARVKKGQTNLHPLSPLMTLAHKQTGGVVYEYYLKGKNGLTPIRHFRKQVLPLMADREEEMQAFLEEFDFAFSNPLSYILLINYYNQIKKEVLTKANEAGE